MREKRPGVDYTQAARPPVTLVKSSTTYQPGSVKADHQTAVHIFQSIHFAVGSSPGKYNSWMCGASRSRQHVQAGRLALLTHLLDHLFILHVNLGEPLARPDHASIHFLGRA